MLIISGLVLAAILGGIWALDLTGVTADSASVLAMIITVAIVCMLGAGVWRQLQHYHMRHPHPEPRR